MGDMRALAAVEFAEAVTAGAAEAAGVATPSPNGVLLVLLLV